MSKILQPECSAVWLLHVRSKLGPVQFIGDLAQVQELEDFGELLAALEPPPHG